MTTTELEKFESLTEELKTENELSLQSSDIVKQCKIGLRKMRLAKKFVEIDEKILEISTNNEYSSNFFSGILSLEAKRLAFKEEAIKCQNPKLQIR